MIKDEVLYGHLKFHPNEVTLINLLTSDFEVTWASRNSKFNSDISVYFLKPLKHITESFGFEQELLLAISTYPQPEARLIQSLEYIFQQIPAKGRVDQTVCLIISDAKNITEWVRDYLSQNPQGRAYIGIPKNEILSSNDPWYLRNVLVSQLYSRDLFEYTLPLNEDLFFFGRQAIVAEYIDSIKKSENFGLFGLRKTGKTSVLFKVLRQCRSSNMISIYYDCKLSSIYRLSGDDLIRRIIDDIETELRVKVKGWRGKKLPSDQFVAFIKNIPDDVKICLIFDEIEYISAASTTAPHWSKDFVPFWQTIWSTQSQHRRFCFAIAGVNASVIETDRIQGVQNPMFGIVKSRYLTGFEKGELFSLLSVLGKRMGMTFNNEAVHSLYARYGGHPLLTRMICSQINNELKARNVPRPAKIDQAAIRRDIDNREHEIQFYCRHITSELEDFYSDEYEVLELLATGNTIDFNDMAQDIDLVRHLRSYGLVDFSTPFKPKFAIPVIQSYIVSKWKRKNGIKSDRYIVPEKRRSEYVTGRLSSVLRDLRMAEKTFKDRSLPDLYSGSGPAEAERFAVLSPVASRDDAVAFLNQCNRSIVEPLDRTGSNLGRKNYFFGDLNSSYPHLWPAINRIRTYRNLVMHLDLTPLARQQLTAAIDEDFDGELPEKVMDGWFRLQSAILDGLLVGIQAELASYE